MSRHLRFLENTLDAVPDHVVVISESGEIEFANEAWAEFGLHNGATVKTWQGVNYFGICERAAAEGYDAAADAKDAIAAVLREDRVAAFLDYPCRSPTQRRWFRMIVTSFCDGEQRHGVVLHRDLTEAMARAQSTEVQAG